MARDSAHDFIVNFSPSVCVAVVVSLTTEMHGCTKFCLPCMLMEQQTVAIPAVILGLCAMISAMNAHSGSPPPTPMINHVTSVRCAMAFVSTFLNWMSIASSECVVCCLYCINLFS